MPDQTTTVILQGMNRLKLLELTEPYPYLKGKVDVKDEQMPEKDDKVFLALVEA